MATRPRFQTVIISYCQHVDPTYTAKMRFNWKSVRLATLVVSIGALGTGCSGINATHSVSPATFLIPGLMQNPPAQPLPVDPSTVAPASPTLAQAN